MESQALQELVRKIFSDEETKSQFAANPESVKKRQYYAHRLNSG